MKKYLFLTLCLDALFYIFLVSRFFLKGDMRLIFLHSFPPWPFSHLIVATVPS